MIPENLYYQVQDVLDGRKRGQYKLKVASNATLPLRGFLICPTCGKVLTGSMVQPNRLFAGRQETTAKADQGSGR